MYKNNENANLFKEQRDNIDFRTGTKGDPRNIDRYSEFAKKTGEAVVEIAFADSSQHTKGYTTMNRFLNEIEYYTIDGTAKQVQERSYQIRGKQRLIDGLLKQIHTCMKHISLSEMPHLQ